MAVSRSDRSNSKLHPHPIVKAGHFIDKETGAFIPGHPALTTFARTDTITSSKLHLRAQWLATEPLPNTLCDWKMFLKPALASGMVPLPPGRNIVSASACRPHHHVSRLKSGCCALTMRGRTSICRRRRSRKPQPCVIPTNRNGMDETPKIPHGT